MKKKRRIVIVVVNETGSSKTTIVEGRIMGDGTPSPGPTEKQFAIVNRAILELIVDTVESRE